jgi:fermentation-respiration switch protein FrsA (DUF1100 family)
MSWISTRKWLLVSSGVLLAAYLGSSIAGGVLLMENALRLKRIPVTRRAEFAANAREVAGAGVEDVSIAAADGAVLKGWYLRPQAWNYDSVILLHGVGDNREGVEGYASMLLRAGYAVLLPDSRAHGESGGGLVTYGLLESDDIRRWAWWLGGRTASSMHGSSPACIDLFGESLGAALALQATAKTPGICAVVAEAPFASFREIGYERIAQATHLSVRTIRFIAWPTVEVGFLDARIRYGLDFEKASPERALAVSHVPALLIVGLADQNIPPRHAREILQESGSTTELWEVPGAGHTGAASIAPSKFERRVLGWLRTHHTPITPPPVQEPPSR